jgi:hypothetical protein
LMDNVIFISYVCHPCILHNCQLIANCHSSFDDDRSSVHLGRDEITHLLQRLFGIVDAVCSIESASHNSVRTIEFANGCLVHSIRKLNKKNCDGMSHQWMAAQMQMQYSMPRWNVQLWANVM